ncbi:hypothetical protein BRD56_04370 [Thermoplasmatales archaeon SW_10_69_26]|nr:MAG: hypothetical protein BRD56_04370 [Thermoplasmatales archaeon SW_10_69_26]
MLLSQGCIGSQNDRQEFADDLEPSVESVEVRDQGTTATYQPEAANVSSVIEEMLFLLYEVHNVERTFYQANGTEAILNNSEYVRLDFGSQENITLPNYRGTEVKMDKVIAILSSSQETAPIGRLLLCSDLACSPYATDRPLHPLRSTLNDMP